jgi:predicted RNA-binding protein with TRAM domain
MASLEKPVEEGKEYEVEIEDLSRRGDGLAKIEGFIIFIPGTKPGDRVNIRVTQVRDRFAVAEKI